jgi:hypothetical protein
MLAAQTRVPGQAPAQERKEREDIPSAEKLPSKAILEANEKDIKKSVERLYQLASDLKEEVEKTNSAQILSLGMVKKAEEIEKLARDIKTRAKG